MEYTDFVQALTSSLREALSLPVGQVCFYPRGFIPHAVHEKRIVEKINRDAHQDTDALVQDCLCVYMNKSFVGPVQMVLQDQLEEYYVKAQEEGFDESLTKTTALLVESWKKVADEWNHQNAFDKVRDQLVIRPINYMQNREELKGCIYEKVGNIALTLYIELGHYEHNYMSMKVNEGVREQWDTNLSPKEIFHEALLNTMRKYPAQVCDVRQHKIFNFLNDTFTLEQIALFDNVMLSNSNSTNGAIALWYPGVLEKFYTLYGGPFYAVFMNQNDVMIRDVRLGRPHELVEMARHPNQQMGIPLSNKVYKYDGTKLFYV